MSNIFMWMKGILFQRKKRIVGITLGVALTVSLFMSLGLFILSSNASMTSRAVRDVPLDWQILLSRSADSSAVRQAVKQVTPYTAYAKVGYADTNGFVATTGGSTQITGPGKALGITADYQKQFPGEIRHLIGSNSGVLLAQQTAANLHAKVGDVVTIKRVGLPPAKLKVDGIVALPNADSLFQAVGVPTGTAPQAPPDNVILMPMKHWQAMFQPQARVRPDSVKTELHINILHHLSSNPNDAYKQVTGMAKHVEAKISGNGVVANNLAVRIDGVRGDALYSKVLFLFLGSPGVVLALLLTWVTASSGSMQRRKEQALLRVRGASSSVLLRLAVSESVIVGILGILLGSVLTALTARALFWSQLVVNSSMWLWCGFSILLGILISVLSVLYPAWNDAKHTTVQSAKLTNGLIKRPMWKVIYLDFILIALSLFSFWRLSKTGYQLVLASEGVAKTSVHYDAFIAPLFFWIGGTLMFLRITEWILTKGKSLLSAILRPVAHHLAPVVSSSLNRERKRIIQGILLVVLAFSFAASTSIFNVTYHAQSLVDAQLTNGSDVTVQAPTFTDSEKYLSQIRHLKDVQAAQPMQHRFAFVGNDLQDIYGIDAKHITEATTLSNSYFYHSTVKKTLDQLSRTPDGVLVSAETARDYQLQVGDELNLRLQSASDHKYHTIKFHFIGIVQKFPTAPKDSFLVANSSYIAQQTQSGAAEITLISAKKEPQKLAKQVSSIVGSLSGVQVSDIQSARETIRSSLTAVDLRGLTHLELIYAILFTAGAAGLMLALGLADKRRTYTLLTAIGANSKQTASFIWSEGLLIIVPGALVGLGLGTGIAQMLVKVLKGAFDPPPDSLHIQWAYLIILTAAGFISTALAVIMTKFRSQKEVTRSMRSL